MYLLYSSTGNGFILGGEFARLDGMETIVFLCGREYGQCAFVSPLDNYRLAFAKRGYISSLLFVYLHSCRYIFPVTHHCSCECSAYLEQFIC